MNTAKMLKWRKRFLLGTVWGLVGGFAGIAIIGVLFILLDAIFGELPYILVLVFGFLPSALLFLAMVVGIFLVLPYWLLVILIVATSRNEGGYKALWLITLVIFGFFGAWIWEILGKSELELSKR